MSSIPQSVLMRTSYEEREHQTQKKTVAFEEPNQELIEVEKKTGNKRIFPGSRMLKKVDTWLDETRRTTFFPGSLGE